MSSTVEQTLSLIPQRTLIYITISAAVLVLLFRPFSKSLSKLPGPFLSKWTNLELKIQVLLGKRIYYVHSLHTRYGPVVRLSPGEVSVANPSTAKQIHKVSSAFNKSPWYFNFTGGKTNIFTMTDRAQHSSRKKLLAQPMSESGLRSFEEHIKSRALLTVSKIAQEEDTEGCADVFKWFMLMTTDVIGDLAFGQGFETLELGKKNRYMQDVEKATALAGIQSELPLLVRLLSILPIPSIREIHECYRHIDDHAEQALQRLRKSIDDGSAKPTFLSKFSDSKDQDIISDKEYVDEAGFFIIAGTDTTAVTLTYLVWAVAKHQKIQQALCEEVAELPTDFGNSELKELDLLNRIIDETLRLYGAAPGALPRTIPPAGLESDGIFIPGGLTVSTQAFTLHRDPSVFKNPDIFDPCRWEKSNVTVAMKDAFMPFGGPSRVCLGQHLARMELRLAVAMLYKQFPKGLDVAEGVNGMGEEDMRQVNYFLVQPAGHRCLMKGKK